MMSCARPLPVFIRRLRFLGRTALIALLFPIGALHSQDQSDEQGSVPAADNSPAPSNDAVAPANVDGGAQPDSAYEEPAEVGVQGLERLNSLPAGSFGANQNGIPYGGLFTPTGVYVNSASIFDPNNPTALNFHSLSPGTAAGAGTIQASGEIPFLVHAPEPRNADIKVGPVYVQFHSLDGLVLADDNYRQTQTDRKSELLVLLTLNLSVIAQLTDNLQFVATGSIEYLPLNNQVGFENGINLGLLGPLLAAQFAYSTIVAGWPVVFADDVRSGGAFYGENNGDNFDLFEGSQLYRTENGRYAFRYYQTDRSFNAPSDPLIYYSNSVSALTDRLLPGDIRLTLRLEHEDLWYNQSNRGLPNSRDDFLATAVSERENERFKPFASYEATYVEGNPGVTQSILAGAFGPIDDHLFLTAGGGYYFASDRNNGALFFLGVKHNAGPYTNEQFLIDRTLTDFDQDEVTYGYYRLDQALGPTLYARLFLARSMYHDIVNGGGSDFSDTLGGMELNWYISPRTSLSLAGIYTRQTGFDRERIDTVTGRFILNHSFTDTLLFQLLYQYQHAISNRPGTSYYENIVYLRLIKLLD
jgi:hypothetical protein